jgi:hypothetical protein
MKLNYYLKHSIEVNRPKNILKRPEDKKDSGRNSYSILVPAVVSSYFLW